MPGLSTPTSASIFVPGLSTAMPKLSVAIPGLSATMRRLSATVPRSFTLAFASVLIPGLFALVPLSMPVLPKSSPLPFPALSLPKTLSPDLAAGRQRLDNIISGWSRRCKRVSSEELCSGRIKKAALEETFSLRAPLFPLFFSSSGIGKRKLNKTFINIRPLANNYVEKKVDLSFAVCGCPLTVKLNRPWQ